MDKAQAIHSFWSGFSIPAYDENTVPKDAPLPYITYSVALDNFENVVELDGSVWYKGTSWAEVENKVDEIEQSIGAFKTFPIDGGRILIERGRPFRQRVAGETDTIRRIYINLQVEFLTN